MRPRPSSTVSSADRSADRRSPARTVAASLYAASPGLRRFAACLTTFCVLSSIAGIGRAADEAKFDDAALEFFESKVRPLLATKCQECHGAENPKGGLRLDSRSAVLLGGDTGPAAIAGKPKESLLIDAVNYGDVYQMPPKGKLPAADIETLVRWVELGLPWPGGGGPAASKAKMDVEAQKKAHWAWKPIVRPPVPTVRDAAWPRSDLDRHILAGLEARNLRPAPAADRRSWIRRATFDLIGLPPTPADIEAFVSDTSDQAYERVVDRLLESPHFGERWARHWLDLVRFAETRGHEFEPIIPNAWRYRDYLIRALNADLPYDQFLREHLAGDLLPAPRRHPETGGNESILGTGFWFLGEEVHSPVDIRQDETDRLDNRLDVMTKTFLGLTVSCARCHDHKFDPIPQSDYYAMAGFLLSASYRQAPFETMEQNRQVAVELAQARDAARRDTLGALLRDARPAVARSADYLLVARELLRSGLKLDPPPAAPSEEARARCAETARARQLDPDQLLGWTTQLAEAVELADHPLHLLAQTLADRPGETPEQFVARARGVLDRRYPVSTAPAPLQTIVDYATAPADAWRPDGVAFGLRAAQPGDVVWSDQPQRPIADLTTVAAARRDPFWNPLHTAGSSERDNGGLGGWDRPGRTIRSPKVTLQHGKTFFLVRGAGRSYACVDSHLIVVGPLHGRLLREWDAPADRWQWIEHDLTPYKGHRVHFEFTPKSPDGVLEIARVVEAEQPPPAPPSPAAWVRGAVRDAADADWSELARRFQTALLGGLDSLGADAPAPSPAATPADVAAARSAHAHAVRWLLGWHPQLVQTPADSPVAKAATKLFDRQRELAAQARFESNTAPAMYDGNGVEELLLVRGSPKNPGAPTPRRFLTALGGAPTDGYGTGSGRLVLADQLLADSNPFTARVAVNRVWHHLFGRGLVPTVDNFGVLGQPPTHPELLDLLADRFRHEQRWSLKQLVKSIVLSQTYGMSSQADPQAVEADPLNLAWHHMPVRRLQAEAIRDAVLAVSGRLDRTVQGPPVEVHLTPFMDGRGRPGGSGPLDGAGRRSVYTKVRRNFLPPMMLAFDMPIPFNTMGRRSVSNVPAQALILMNDPFVLEQAKVWARRTLTEAPSPPARIDAMYRSAFGRPPTDAESEAARQFLDQQGERYGIPPAQRPDHLELWTDLAHVLFNTKEFIFLR